MSVYDPENFEGRVEFAARRIASGARTTRSFDTCFEMCDADAVATALWRRAQARPEGRLARNLHRYLDREAVEASVAKCADVPTGELGAFAAKLRREWTEAVERAAAERRARSSAETSGAETPSPSF